MSLSPQTYDLCLAVDVAADLNVTADDRVQRAVTAASRAIADYCARTFEKGTGIVEYPASDGRTLLSLKRPPIASIASITEQGSPVASADYECVGDNAEAGLVLRRYCGWMSTQRLDRDSISDTAEGSYGQTDLIVATYTGGWVTPGQNVIDSVTYPVVTLPAAVQEAAINVASTFLRWKGVDPNVSLEAIGDWQIRYYERKEDAIPPFARSLLAPYKLGWAL